MSEVGDFLEALYAPEPRFRTVKAIIRHSCCESPSKGDEDTFRVLFVPPDRARIEESRSRRGQKEEYVTLVDGATWHRRGPGKQQVSGVARRYFKCPWLVDVQRHFDKAFLRVCLSRMITLTSAGALEFCGSRCCQIRAVPDSSKGIWPHWLPYPAEEYEFIVDPSRGVVLSIVAYWSGSVFAVNEVFELRYDEEIDWVRSGGSGEL